MPDSPAADETALLRKPFDHYARYRLAADVVVEVGARSVLDVGGGPGSLQAFLPDRRVVACDYAAPGQWHAAAPALVLADGAALPFADGAFDAVVSLDTLEHVPERKRAAFLQELVRVSAGWVLVVCPCDTDGVADADRALLAFVERKFGPEFDTVAVLREHLGFGHPDPRLVEDTLRGAGCDVVRFPSGRIDRWLPLMVLFYDLLALGRDEVVEEVQAWYNRRFYREDLRAPSYRTAFLARRPEGDGVSNGRSDTASPGAIAAGLLPAGPPLVAEPAALEVLTEALTNELLVVVDRERARAAAAEESLAATAGRLAEAQGRAAAAEAEVASLAARLADAERTVAALEEFRRQILAHPLLRARRALRRLTRR